MRILADENIPLHTIEVLRSLGHDVVSAHDPMFKGTEDTNLWTLAQSESRLLITTDRGFARHREESHSGILIIRLRKPNSQRIHMRVLSAVSEFDEKEWPGLLVIMRDETRGVWRVSSAR